MSPRGNLRLGMDGGSRQRRRSRRFLANHDATRFGLSGREAPDAEPLRIHQLTTHLGKGFSPMHSIVFLTALTATTGLFGGARHCRTGQCGRPSAGYVYQQPVAPCQTAACQAPVVYAPAAAPQAVPGWQD